MPKPGIGGPFHNLDLGCGVERFFKKCRIGFRRDERGAVFVEGLIALPVITIFAAGIFELGNVLWQRNQLQVGIRDAARYVARCPDPNSGTSACDWETARAIAFYGKPAVTVGANEFPRVPGWPGSQTAAEAISFVYLDAPGDTVQRIRVTGTHNYPMSGWVGATGIPSITLEYSHVQRIIGR